MTLLNDPRTRRRRLGVAAACTGLLAALLTAVPAAATPDPGDGTAVEQEVSPGARADAAAAIADGEIPGKDEIVHSANIEHLANIPKDALPGTNSDLAFQGRYAFAGNYDGFRVFDISKPEVAEDRGPGALPRLAERRLRHRATCSSCRTDSSRSDSSCNSTTQPVTEKSSWEGMKVFDISDKANPKYVAAVETACGSHTHTLVPERKNVYIYVSSYSPSAAYPDCQPPHDGISVIKVPRKAPEKAAVVELPRAVPRRPGRRRNPGGPTNPGVSKTTGCHDITVLPEKDLAAGACMGDGILFYIKDPEHPKVIDQVQDNVNFAFWHSATFNHEGEQGRVHRRARRRRSRHLQRGDRPEPRRRRHLRHRRQGGPAQTRLPQLLQDPPSPGGHRELRRPQRLPDPGEGQGPHGPGLVPGRRLRMGLHRLGEAEGDRLLRARPA